MPPKRPHQVVDLTLDDDEPPAKTRVYQQSSYHSQPASQTSTGEALEPEAIDLTQQDDGPPMELYCTWGMSWLSIRI